MLGYLIYIFIKFLQLLLCYIYMDQLIGKGYVTQFGDKLLMDAAVFIDVKMYLLFTDYGVGGSTEN